MDAEARAKALKQELEAMGAEENKLRGRIAHLKRMIEEKTRRKAELQKLKDEETELLKKLVES